MTIVKYSALNIEAAATKEQINSVAIKLGLSQQELLQLIQDIDPSRKYEVWLLKQMAFLNIRLPEDSERVNKMLRNFEQLNQRRQLKHTNLNQYKSIYELEDEIKAIRGELPEDVYDYNVQEFLKLQGVSVYGQNNEFFILKVTNPESLTKLGDSTEWCTRHIENAKNYLNWDKAIYVIFKKEFGKLKKFAQFSQNFNQFKDVRDEELLDISDSLYALVTSNLPENFNILKRNKRKKAENLSQYRVWEEGLDLSGTEIEELPENLFIKDGSLNLSDCKNLKRLPNKIRIARGALILKNCTGLISVSSWENLNINGALDFSGCKELISLPEDSEYIHFPLNLTDCVKLEKLPSGVKVYNSLNLSNCVSLKELPTEVEYRGILNITNCKSLEKLPNSLDVYRFFAKGCTGLKGDVLSTTKITATIEVDFTNCENITATPAKISAEALFFDGCKKLKKISKDLYISSFYSTPKISLKDCVEIEELPEGIEYSMVWDFTNCVKLKTFPKNFKAKQINLTGCSSLKKLPLDIWIIEHIKGVNLFTGKTWEEEYDEIKKEQRSKYGKVIKRYSQLHLSSSREILKVMLPGKYSPRALYIYKNPQPFDIQNLNKRFREEFPTAPKGEPKTRRTYDEQGNEYVWMSGDAMHFTMEHALYKQYGIKTDQNADKYPVEKDKFAEK